MVKSRLAAAAVLAVLCAALVSVTGSAAQAAGASARAANPRPLAGEVTSIRGTVKPARRVVRLQMVRRGHWASVKATRTKSGGRYAFAVRAWSGVNRYRVYAPRKGRAKARASRPVTVTGVRAGLAFAAPVVDNAGRTQAVATAMLRPARPGTPVRVYRRSGSRWIYTATARQNGAGIARFGRLSAGSPSSPAVYRAAALPGRGAYTTYSVPANSMRLSRVAFSDEFSGSTLSSKWHSRIQDYNPHRNCSKPMDKIVRVGGGVATLQVKRTGARAGCPKGAWGYPMIGTAHLDKPYGYYAARVKFQHDRGMHGGFWLQGGTEIDVVEHFGYHRPVSNLLHNGAVNTGNFSVGGDRPVARTILGRSTPYSGYHVYSVQWSPAGYVFRLDGVPTLVANQKKTDRPAEIILSLAISDWEMPALNTRTVGASSAAMRVDWVRAWQ